MIEFTLFNAVAVVLAIVGLTFIVNAFRHALIDEALYGSCLLLIAWWLL